MDGVIIQIVVCTSKMFKLKHLVAMVTQRNLGQILWENLSVNVIFSVHL